MKRKTLVPKRIKNLFNSPFTLPILSKICSGYRPSQIAEQLRITPQRLYYYTNSLVAAGFVCKERDNSECNTISWRLTEKGRFILKEMLIQSVNCERHGVLPIRLHNVTFAFKIKSFPQNPRLRWKPIKNGVSKCYIYYSDHTLELTKSAREGASVMEIHLPEQYFFDPFKVIIRQYDKARGFANLAAQRMKLVISENGDLIKKPHMAFERDLVALFLTRFQTAALSTKAGKVWIDNSNGSGEQETNDPEYAFRYLNMPKAVNNIDESVNRMEKRSYPYTRCYHPYLIEGN